MKISSVTLITSMRFQQTNYCSKKYLFIIYLRRNILKFNNIITVLFIVVATLHKMHLF